LNTATVGTFPLHKELAMTHTDPDIPAPSEPDVTPPDTPGPDIDPSGVPDEIPQFEQGREGGDYPPPQAVL